MHKSLSLNSAHVGADLSIVLRRTRLLASDFDGSIVPDHQKEFMENPDVLLAAQLMRGFEGTPLTFATVTGSRISRAKPWADESGTALFAENAGILYDPKDASGKVKVLIDQEEADFVIRQVAPLVERFLDRTFPGYEKSDGKITMATYHKPEHVQIDEFRDAVFGFLASVLSPEDYARLFLTHSHTLVDINHVGADKSRAIKFMRRHFRIPVDAMTVYGDGDNDRPAFEAALAGNGTVVVPANYDGNVGGWLSEKRNEPRIAVHHLESTECLIDIVRNMQRS